MNIFTILNLVNFYKKISEKLLKIFTTRSQKLLLKTTEEGKIIKNFSEFSPQNSYILYAHKTYFNIQIYINVINDISV